MAGDIISGTASQTSTGDDDVKTNVVIIDGKERPLENYEGELKRKHTEEIERIKQDGEDKIAAIQAQATSTPTQQPNQQSWYDQVAVMAEDEMARTGKTIPINTILQVSNSISQKNYETNSKTRTDAERVTRSFKRSIRKDPDFAIVEDDFDELVDQMKSSQISQKTLEIALNSVRGAKAKDREKAAYERGLKEATSDTQILNQPTSGGGSGTKPKTSLTPEQLVELDEMNKDNSMEWTEDEYKASLLKKQNEFKLRGARNVPQTLNSNMIN